MIKNESNVVDLAKRKKGRNRKRINSGNRKIRLLESIEHL